MKQPTWLKEQLVQVMAKIRLHVMPTMIACLFSLPRWLKRDVEILIYKYQIYLVIHLISIVHTQINLVFRHALNTLNVLLLIMSTSTRPVNSINQAALKHLEDSSTPY